MITLEANYIYLLITSNAIMLALACMSIAKFERRCDQIEKFWKSPTGTSICEKDGESSGAQETMTQQLEEKVSDLQRSIKVIETSKVELEPASVERRLPIENAVRMARLGASIEDLTKNCGLNVGEARLMKKLHGRDVQRAVSN